MCLLDSRAVCALVQLVEWSGIIECALIAGAIVISLYIIYSWIRISKGQASAYLHIDITCVCCKLCLCGSAPLHIVKLLLKCAAASGCCALLAAGLPLFKPYICTAVLGCSHLLHALVLLACGSVLALLTMAGNHHCQQSAKQ